MHDDAAHEDEGGRRTAKRAAARARAEQAWSHSSQNLDAWRASGSRPWPRRASHHSGASSQLFATSTMDQAP